MSQVLSYLWNIKFIKGHRTMIAQVGLGLTSVLMAYQGLATDAGLIGNGIDLPDLPNKALVWTGVAAAYFAKKVKQFANEHK